jgi:triosephosphate isomerase
MDAGDGVRVIYGGSVGPEYAEELLASPDVDGLGVGRKGRDPVAFAQIVRLIAEGKGLNRS